MSKITAYYAPDGTITLRWPKGTIPDRKTLEAVAQAIAEHKKSPSASGNLQKGNPTGRSAQENYTTPSAERQEGRPEK